MCQVVFPGYSRFAPPIDWLVSMSEVILKGTFNKLNPKKKKKKKKKKNNNNIKIYFIKIVFRVRIRTPTDEEKYNHNSDALFTELL